MKLIPSTSSLVVAGALLALAASPAAAQLRHDRGTILNIDMQARQIEIKDAKDRERIWPFAADATVQFSDKAWQNRSSALKDLRTGMYVHFRYAPGDPEVIQEFDVKDIGKSGASSVNPQPQPPAGLTTGRVTAVDLNVAQVAVTLDGGGLKTYQAANARVLAGVKAGDRIGMRLERDANGQDILVQVEPLRR